MRTGKRLIILLLLVIFAGSLHLVHAQPNTLYFMKGIPQTKDLNPARPGITGGFYFSMPLFSKLDLAANTNNWAYNDLIHKGSNSISLNNSLNNINRNLSDSLVIDLDKFSGKTGNKNFFYESAALTLLEGGYKNDKNFYAFSLSEREFAQVFFHKNLIDLINYGNYPYVGQTYHSGNMGIGAQHYLEFAFNYSHDMNKKLTIGGAAKILFGMGAVQSNNVTFKATSPANGELLNVTAAGRVNISGPVDFDYNFSNGLINSVKPIPNYTLRNYLSNFRNPGIAVDLGIAYRTNKRTELSASVIDLGMIGWSSHVTRWKEHGNFQYRGINLNDLTSNPLIIDALDVLGHDIRKAFAPDTTGTSFSTLLPAKIYLGVDHQLSNSVSVSGLTRVRIIGGILRTSLTASANAYIFNGLSLTASYSLMESTYDNLGLGVGIKTGPFQIYAATDNLISPFFPAKARNMNLRVGINFIFNDDRSNGKKGSSSNQNCHCPY